MSILELVARVEDKLDVWLESYLYGRMRWLMWLFIAIMLSPIVWAFIATR